MKTEHTIAALLLGCVTCLTTIGCGDGGPGGETPQMTVGIEEAFPGLSFARPVFLTAAPDGTDWIYVVEQDGTIRVFRNDDALSSHNLFLDIVGRVQGPDDPGGGFEEGLLGLAFDPDYGTNGLFYVHYSAGGPRRSVIARFTATFNDPNAPTASPATEEIILEVNQPAGNHNSGMIDFGPDGMFYVSFGDGGGGGDPGEHGQDPTTLLGAMLRIDPRNPPMGQTYAIPADNPMVGQGGGVREEIWAYGFRNPWRWSFDRDSGALWLGDVGQGAREEVDLVSRGSNYGWDVYEGNASFENPSDLPASQFAGPVIDYGRDQGQSITGGYVYRGQDVPSLSGWYVYGDYGSGRIWALRWNGTAVEINAEIQNVPAISSFGEDERGELYVVSHNGSIWRLLEPEAQ